MKGRESNGQALWMPGPASPARESLFKSRRPEIVVWRLSNIAVGFAYSEEARGDIAQSSSEREACWVLLQVLRARPSHGAAALSDSHEHAQAAFCNGRAGRFRPRLPSPRSRSALCWAGRQLARSRPSDVKAPREVTVCVCVCECVCVYARERVRPCVRACVRA